MSEMKINYVYKSAGPFKTTYSCTHQDVEEEFFYEMMHEIQHLRRACEAVEGKCYCEQCEHFGRKAEFFSEQDNEVTILENALDKELAE